MRIKLLTYLLIIIISATFVSAVGIAPVTQRIIYDNENKQGEIYVRLLNVHQKEIDVLFRLDGKVAQYFTPRQTELHFTSDESIKEVKLMYDFPELDSGLYILNLIASERQSEISGISAISAVVAEITVLVPIPGKVVDAKFYVFPRYDHVSFSLPVSNLGQQDIDQASAIIEIWQDNTIIKTLTTKSVSIPSKTAKRLTAAWNNPEEGSYKANATIQYDGNSLSLEKAFTSAREFVSVRPIALSSYGSDITNLILEGSNPLDSIVTVYASINIIDSDGNMKDKISTDSVPINSGQSARLVSYLNTRHYYDGVYDLVIEVFQNTKPVSVVEYEKALIIDSSALVTGAAIGPKKTEYIQKGIITILILTIVYIGLAILQSKKKFL